MDLLVRETQFPSDVEVLNLAALGEAPYGAHIDLETSGYLFWRQKGIFGEPVGCVCLLHPMHMESLGKPRKNFCPPTKG